MVFFYGAAGWLFLAVSCQRDVSMRGLSEMPGFEEGPRRGYVPEGRVPLIYWDGHRVIRLHYIDSSCQEEPYLCVRSWWWIRNCGVTGRSGNVSADPAVATHLHRILCRSKNTRSIASLQREDLEDMPRICGTRRRNVLNMPSLPRSTTLRFWNGLAGIESHLA